MSNYVFINKCVHSDVISLQIVKKIKTNTCKRVPRNQLSDLSHTRTSPLIAFMQEYLCYWMKKILKFHRCVLTTTIVAANTNCIHMENFWRWSKSSEIKQAVTLCSRTRKSDSNYLKFMMRKHQFYARPHFVEPKTKSLFVTLRQPTSGCHFFLWTIIMMTLWSTWNALNSWKHTFILCLQITFRA